MTRWYLGCAIDYIMYREVNNKAVRLGVSVSTIMRMAINDYMEHHPKELEQEEKQLYSTGISESEE